MQSPLTREITAKQLTRCNQWPLSSCLSPSSPLFLRQLRLDETHWQRHPPSPGLSSITMSHNIAGNQSDYQSAITPTRPKTLLILMTDKCWPSQSAVDKPPLIFSPSTFSVSRHHPTSGMMDSPQIRGRMCWFLKTCIFAALHPLLLVLAAISQQ